MKEKKDEKIRKTEGNKEGNPFLGGCWPFFGQRPVKAKGNNTMKQGFLLLFLGYLGVLGQTAQQNNNNKTTTTTTTPTTTTTTTTTNNNNNNNKQQQNKKQTQPKHNK